MPTLTRRAFAAAFATGLLCGPALAQSASYPNRTIQIIVPFPAGGAVDLTARLVAEKLRARFDQPVVVENRPGANGMIGAAAVARAAPDGYTLLVAPREVFGINPLLQPQQAPDPRTSFAYVGVIVTAPYALIVNPRLGVSNLTDLKELGQRIEIDYASYGHGSMAHLNIEALAKALSLKVKHVPYRGSAPAVLGVATGEVGLSIATPPVALSMMQDGKVRALAVGAPTRLPQMPDIPTMRELGLAEDPLTWNYFGFAAPAGTPADVVSLLNAEVARAIAEPDLAGRMDASGLIPAPGTPQAMADIVISDLERFGRLIRELNIKAD